MLILITNICAESVCWREDGDGDRFIVAIYRRNVRKFGLFPL